MDLHEKEPVNDTNERILGKKFNQFPNTVNSEYGKGIIPTIYTSYLKIIICRIKQSRSSS